MTGGGPDGCSGARHREHPPIAPAQASLCCEASDPHLALRHKQDEVLPSPSHPHVWRPAHGLLGLAGQVPQEGRAQASSGLWGLSDAGSLSGHRGKGLVLGQPRALPFPDTSQMKTLG